MRPGNCALKADSSLKSYERTGVDLANRESQLNPCGWIQTPDSPFAIKKPSGPCQFVCIDPPTRWYMVLSVPQATVVIDGAGHSFGLNGNRYLSDTAGLTDLLGSQSRIDAELVDAFNAMTHRTDALKNWKHAPRLAHPGRLGKDGCHTVRKRFCYQNGRCVEPGEYHCHRALIGKPIVLDGLEVLGERGDDQQDEEQERREREAR